MKKLCILIALIAIFDTSCKKQNASPVTSTKHPTNGKGQTLFAASNYEASVDAWATYKASISNSYKYTALNSSFAGFEQKRHISLFSPYLCNIDAES
ncbi:hypothetical protein [Mucilaginibacter gilvus]|uniref:hypothetical protein n=1 Tax=Mucilaginibacter gilvus TaxID=2305909 RepID=UPI00141A094F|nr:hypothetical protein [Mucilaginibacter gilvus]